MSKKIARIISEIMNGFVTMLIPPVLVIWLSSLEDNQKISLSIYYILSAMLPFAILRKLGKTSDYEFTDRKERPPYFITLTILFLAGYFVIKGLGIESITTVSLNILTITAIFTLITFFWKISGHMTYGTLFLMTIIYLFPGIPELYLIFLAIPPLAWSRVELGKHTYKQTIAGTALSLTISFLIYFVL